jgi:Bacterial dnaA protein helix-turn-helix
MGEKKMTVDQMLKNYARIRREFFKTEPKPVKSETLSVKNIDLSNWSYTTNLSVNYNLINTQVHYDLTVQGVKKRKSNTVRVSARWKDLLNRIYIETAYRPDQLFSAKRTKTIVTVRHLLWAVAVDALCVSYSELGRRCNRDHTTIMHGARNGRKHPLYKRLCDDYEIKKLPA